jgi:exosome complex RNA-binding protein Rrp42 (RNase PH superfamily)
MSYNTKNYREHGGEKTVIAGEVVIAAGAQVSVDPAAIIEGVPSTELNPAASQAESTAATIEDLVLDFNSLLAKLKAAGLMSTT